MQKISQEENEELCNGENILSKQELKVVQEILQAVENIEYRQWKHINGGYADVQIDGYDDEYVEAGMESGEQDMGSGFSSSDTATFKVPRELLLNKMSLEKKLKKIEWGN